MTTEQLEFAITRYLDGTLPSEERAALEERLATDPQAQALLAEHEKLTALLRSPLPEMAWSELAGDFSAVVTGTVDPAAHEQERKLNAILKASPALPSVRWDALAQQISGAIDAEIAAPAESDEDLDVLLRSAPQPSVNWDRLADQISSSIAAENEAAERKQRRAFSLTWVRAASGLAVAAVLAIAAMVGVRAYLDRESTGGGSGLAQGPIPIAKIDGPRNEVATGPAVVEIQIGPSPAFASSYEAEDVRSAMAKGPIVIASPARPAEESGGGFMFE